MSNAEERRRFYGVYPAIVSDIRDPEGRGRVKVSLPDTVIADSVISASYTPGEGNLV
jgi:hypothetical protein